MAADEMVLASYNLDNGRKPSLVADEVSSACHKYGIDVMVCQEGKRYWSAVGCRAGVRVVLPEQRRARWRDTFALVSTDHAWAARHVASHPMTERWERGPGNRRLGLHPARVLNIFEVEWVDRLAAIHMPPTPQSERHPNIRKSYPRRDRAWQEYLNQLQVLCEAWTGRGLTWVLAGDFNITATDRRIEEFADRVDGSIRGRGIDYFILGPGVVGSDVDKPKHGAGDHGHVALITIHRKERHEA